jgi:hypothetical protein
LSSASLALEMSSRRKTSLLEYRLLTIMSISRSTWCVVDGLASTHTAVGEKWTHTTPRSAAPLCVTRGAAAAGRGVRRRSCHAPGSALCGGQAPAAPACRQHTAPSNPRSRIAVLGGSFYSSPLPGR